MRLVVSSIALLALAVACTSLESEDIETDGINPDIVLTGADGQNDTRVAVTLHAGNSITTFIDLGEGDALSATADGTTVALDEQNLLGVFSYTGSLATTAAGTEVTVAFTRTEGDSAPASKVTLTDPLSITAPTNAPSFSRANDVIDVTFDGAGDDPVTISWDGSCVVAGSQEVSEAAAAHIAAASIEKRADPDEGEPTPDNCDVTLTLSRARTGALDPAWGGGSIRHSFSDSVTVTSTP